LSEKYDIIYKRVIFSKELKMKKVIDYFIINGTMANGEKFETIRHTRDGLIAVINSLWEDEEVTSFSVEEKMYEGRA
jgi:coenzyme F420-reducing hydrogenase gamma subunit